ncbi:SH3 domain-containing protein [Sulfurimonas sp.]|uniref:SH3 domain-containing protein n=1 Tax=Sulfurimonas sp. TaxID=2022749 RepID=UPI002AB28C05|nr:SH3 domain-containing protein [Sulfurimonas sp.]
MKIMIIAFFSIVLLWGEESSLVTRAVTKLIDENKKIQSQLHSQKKQIEALQQQIDKLISSKNLSFKSYKAHIGAKVLNIRSGPGFNYRIITSLKKGEKVLVVDSTHRTWYKIYKNNQEGWAYAKWIIINNNNK